MQTEQTEKNLHEVKLSKTKPRYRCSRMASGLIRCGLAKNENHANFMLLGLVIFNTVVSIIILSTA